VHLRDGALLHAVVGHTARQFARAIVMPNLRPPITTAAAAAAYRERILAALLASAGEQAAAGFTPLMTAYLTESIDPAELELGFREGIFTAAKLYPAGATTFDNYCTADNTNFIHKNNIVHTIYYLNNKPFYLSIQIQNRS
jgi:dihydroorotase